MSPNDQTDAFQYALDVLIKQYKAEFDLNEQMIIGCLEVAKLELITAFEVDFIPEDEIEEDDDLDTNLF